MSSGVPKDWRLEMLESSGLRGVRFVRKTYRRYSLAWDRDHCAGCRSASGTSSSRGKGLLAGDGPSSGLSATFSHWLRQRAKDSRLQFLLRQRAKDSRLQFLLPSGGWEKVADRPDEGSSDPR